MNQRDHGRAVVGRELRKLAPDAVTYSRVAGAEIVQRPLLLVDRRDLPWPVELAEILKDGRVGRRDRGRLGRSWGVRGRGQGLPQDSPEVRLAKGLSQVRREVDRDERHVGLRGVERVAVTEIVFVKQAFPVVARDDDEGLSAHRRLDVGRAGDAIDAVGVLRRTKAGVTRSAAAETLEEITFFLSY